MDYDIIKIWFYSEAYTRHKNLIKEQWIHSLVKVVIEGLEVDIVMKKSRDKDKEIVRVVEKMKKIGVKELRGEE